MASFFVPKELKVLALSGAGNEARTRDLNLGKVALYQLSYSRKFCNEVCLSNIIAKVVAL